MNDWSHRAPTGGRTRRLLLAAWLAVACAPSFAAGNGGLVVSAAVLSNNNCRFSTGTNPALNFPAIDPSSTTAAVATTTTSFKCGGSSSTVSYAIKAGDGLYSSAPGARQMRHGTVVTEFLAYSVSMSPSSGVAAKNAVVTVTITGTVAPSAFQGAIAGTYTDTVALTVTP